MSPTSQMTDILNGFNHTIGRRYRMLEATAFNPVTQQWTHGYRKNNRGGNDAPHCGAQTPSTLKKAEKRAVHHVSKAGMIR